MFRIAPLKETHPEFTQKMENSFDVQIFSNMNEIFLGNFHIKDGKFKFTSPVWPIPQKRLVLNIVKPISWCHWQK